MDVEIKIKVKSKTEEQKNKKSQDNTEFELSPDGKRHTVSTDPNVKIEITEE